MIFEGTCGGGCVCVHVRVHINFQGHVHDTCVCEACVHIQRMQIIHTNIPPSSLGSSFSNPEITALSTGV